MALPWRCQGTAGLGASAIPGVAWQGPGSQGLSYHPSQKRGSRVALGQPQLWASPWGGGQVRLWTHGWAWLCGTHG